MSKAKISMCDVQLVKLKEISMLDARERSVVSSEVTVPERRSCVHFPIDLPFKVKYSDKNTNDYLVIEGRTRDISENGAGIILSNSIPSHHELFIEFNFANICPHFEIPFHVVWTYPGDNQKTQQYGICFSTAGEEKKQALIRIIHRIQFEEPGIAKSGMIPRIRGNRDLNDQITNLQGWLRKQFDFDFPQLSSHTVDPVKVNRNIENFIGATQIPVGIGGPIRINGQYAQGDFYVPFATTEGTLVETYSYGMMMVTRAGGANVFISGNQMDITPIFVLNDLAEAIRLVSWVKEHYADIKAEAEATTRHGKLLDIKPFIIGREVLLNFSFYTADAMGMNIANIAADSASRYIAANFGVKRFYLRSNFSSDKKPSNVSLVKPYGKEVLVDVTIPRKMLKRFYATTPESVKNFYYCGTLGSLQCGMIGLNAHFANGLAAIYIATGQDVAQVVNASIGIVSLDVTDSGDLYVAAKLPNLIVGTVGGGTSLPTQQECLRIMDCLGNRKANKLAEIIAGTILAGEISIYAALATGNFIDAHRKKRTL
jgi:hydroxymethylglutaryl-CoA reductase (NADPH)